MKEVYDRTYTRAQLDAISTALAELQPKDLKPRRKIGFVQDKWIKNEELNEKNYEETSTFHNPRDAGLSISI